MKLISNLFSFSKKLILNFFRFLKFQVKRLKYLKDSPHEIALGFAFGVWTNFNPFFGINIFIAMGLALLFRANMIASVIGVLITGLPFIFPFFWLISWYVGAKLLFDNYNQNLFADKTSLVENLAEYFTEMLVGSIILFPLIIIIFYFPIRFIVQAWQTNKKLRMEKKSEKNAIRNKY